MKIKIKLFTTLVCFSSFFIYSCEKTNDIVNDDVKSTEIIINTEKSTKSNNIAYVHFLDVGQADSIFIDYLDFEILIDGGNNWNGDFISDYLSDKVDGNLEIIVATHPHADHIGGLDVILEDYEVETIIDSGTEHTTKTYEDYKNAVENEENANFIEDDDMVFEIDENVFFTIIEIVDNVSNINNNSVVCRLDVFDKSFLFTGDLENEQNYLEKFDEVDVLKVAHHGSDTSTSQEFIEKIKPKYAIISCGENNQYGHPAPQILSVLEENNIEIYRTDTQGTIVAEISEENMILRTTKE